MVVWLAWANRRNASSESALVTSWPKTRPKDSAGLTPEINVIGLNSFEAVDRVDAFLDRSVMANLKRVRIIHGVGAGVLRKKITRLLENHIHVDKFRMAELNEGGLGVTVVEVK